MPARPAANKALEKSAPASAPIVKPIKRSPAKSAPVKVPTKKVKSGPAKVIETKMIRLQQLKGFHKNPRVGDIDAIAKSLEANGQFKPIIVNVGTLTGRKNEIVAGNHSYLAARKLGWMEILASFIDVDDQRANAIVLADNKTSDLGTYDTAALADLIKLTDNFGDTGYSELDIADLMKDVNDSISCSLSSIETERAERSAANDAVSEITFDPETGEESPQPRVANSDKADVAEIGDENMEDPQAELQAALILRESNLFIGTNDWGVAELLPDKLYGPLPDDIQTWGGWQATPPDEDPNRHFLYNYSLGGTKNLPFARALLAFFTFDRKFEMWWSEPAYLTAKFIHDGISGMMVPDYSFYYTQPRCSHLTSVYKAQWLGRFFQDAGVKVMPRLQFNYRDPKSLEIALLGIPHGAPVIGTSQQNVDDEKADGANIKAMLKDALDELKPKQLLYYSGPPGRRLMEDVQTDVEVRYVMNYAGVRRGTVFDKKDGLASAKGKNRKRIIEDAKKLAAAKANELDPELEGDND